ncbi:hypothetical protein Tco_0828969 [Tanacetum coccineum]
MLVLMTSSIIVWDPIYAIKELLAFGGSICNTSNCCFSKGSLEDKILVPIPDSSQRPLKIENFCLDYGDPIHGLMSRCALIQKKEKDIRGSPSRLPRHFRVIRRQYQHYGIFCRQCTCKSCGKGAHYGYNCPPKVPIISNPEPCKNQTIDEPLQNLQSLQQQCLLGTCQKCGCNEYDGVCFYCKVGNGTPINVSTPYSSNDSPSVANHPPQSQYVPYSCELCGNDSHYGYDCPPQVPFVYNQDLCFNQNFDYFPQTSPSFPQQYPCCENCGGPHETYQCQPMNEDYYHEQNSCYDYNSFGFDQFQPPQYTVNHPIFNSQNELLNSSNKLMEQMTTLCDLVGQAIQKKEEEKRMAEEQAAKDRYWKIPICYDDDEDDTIAITPVLPIEEPDNSLSMGDEHLDTIPTTESDEVIKSSVENLVPIPSESEGIPDSVCDVPLCNNPTSLEAFKEHSETIIDSNDDSTSSDDDSPYGENIDYVDASPPDVEIVSLEVVEIVIPEVGGIDTNILLTIKDDILREKLLNINLLIAKIDALKDNPAPSSDVMTKSSSTSPNLCLEETNTFDNSSPEAETFCFDLEEISSGSTTTRSDYSLPDYEASI